VKDHLFEAVEGEAGNRADLKGCSADGPRFLFPGIYIVKYIIY
jgi:hypothetical protein